MNPNTHFYLYSKGWYVEDNKMNDLKIIMSNYSGVSIKYITERDVKSKLISLAHYILDKQGHNDYMFSEFVSNVENKGIVDACLIVLGNAIVNDEKLGRPNQDILPLANYEPEDDDHEFNWSE